MRHLVSATTDWVRTSAYDDDSNRLLTTTETAGTVSYQHDVRGNIVFWPHLFNDTGSPPNVEVDFRDQMRRAQLDSSNYAVYHYDHSGQRARKVVKRGANVEERRYVAGWEVWRKTASGTLTEERTTLHVMDDERRVAMIETKTVGSGSPSAVVRYQLDNHLGTSVLELDESGGIISYEEYHPYGTCAWWAGDSAVVSQRRYRYTGMERDEETGLQVHGVRYYAAWLGRWGSADPIGLGDGGNRFAYTRGRPISGVDATGLSTEEYPLATEQIDTDGFRTYPAPMQPSASITFEEFLMTEDGQNALQAAGGERALKRMQKKGNDVLRGRAETLARNLDILENTPGALDFLDEATRAQLREFSKNFSAMAERGEFFIVPDGAVPTESNHQGIEPEGLTSWFKGNRYAVIVGMSSVAPPAHGNASSEANLMAATPLHESWHPVQGMPPDRRPFSHWRAESEYEATLLSRLAFEIEVHGFISPLDLEVGLGLPHKTSVIGLTPGEAAANRKSRELDALR